MRLPTFFLLGAEKAGTTTLHHQLGAHSDVLVSVPKEPHILDLHYQEEGIAGYATLVFAHGTGQPVRGEATPTYLNLPYVADRIREHVPEAKLVVVLRDPVERAYSAWWMFKVRRLERLGFQAAIERNREELSRGIGRLDGPEGEATWHAYVDAIRQGQELLFRTYLQGGWYDEHLGHYLKRFPQEQLKVVLAEDLYERHQETLEETWAFLGAKPPHPSVPATVENAAMGRYASAFIQVAQWTRLIQLAHHVPQRWRMAFKRATSWMGQRPPMDPEVADALRETLAPHVRATQKLVDRDLSHWLPG